ncbi:MAG: 16S rRNA (uracil(1498)-N(3))-methyltransferase [Proteobacteria bacterium]|nr:16S rRNA (uracil(1498)-N(3))-methyltransferase [Pseudomonadota bacterium]
MSTALSRTPRFHLGAALAPGTRLVLPRDAGHHASRVLRLRETDAVVLFSGTGGEYQAHIVRITRDEVEVEIGQFSPLERESPLDVTLVQGISSGDRMDLTIQKVVELGVAAIQPVLAERSVVKLKGERGDSRREHWQRVAASACEQCGRNRVPAVAAAVPVAAYQAPQGALKLLLAPGAQSGLRSVQSASGRPVVFAAGPEAGFSPREEALFVSAGFVPVHLGPRILRTETAGPAALAALNALYGDG